MHKSSGALVMVLLICGAGLAFQPGVIEVPSLRSPGEFDRAAYQAEQQRLLSWLVAEQVEAGLAGPLSVQLSEAEFHTIEFGRELGSQAAPLALITGVVKPATLTFDLDAPSHGAIERTFDGGLVWTAAIRSAGAAGLRVHFESFSLPQGFELWLYSMDGVVRGPYTGRGPNGSGDFWSHTVTGPDAVLQLRGYGQDAFDEVVSFAVTELGHVGTGAELKIFCSFNADCIENAMCESDPAVDEAKDAVALMRFIKRPYIYICSGGLLNDTVDSGTPYFLTANHCISRDREAGTLEAWFNYAVDCDDLGAYDCTDPFSDLSGPSTLGSSVLATNKTSDFTLLLLDGAPPGGSIFMGWTTAEIAVANGAGLYRVSHPTGAPQAYSMHVVDTSAPTCVSWPRGPWIYSRDVVGATEGGSSGSPVVNASGQVVGQLSGACGTNLNDNCDSIRNATVDGAFAAYYAQVEPWLAPGGSCTDNDGDGSCAGDDCDDGDPYNYPGNTENCTDGRDNDCDGYIDSGDPDCAGDCRPAGDPCTTGTDCCSGLCHPRKLTCK